MFPAYTALLCSHVVMPGEAAQESGTQLIHLVSLYSLKSGYLDQSCAFVWTIIVSNLVSFTTVKSYVLG